MPSIYLLLTRSDTIVSRLIHNITSDPYTHVSMSFDSTLSCLYSFSRKNTRLPLPAGFVTEHLDSGIFHINSSMPCALYELTVSAEAYNAALREVNTMIAVSDIYRYSILGLALCKLNISLNRRRHFFCSQFVSTVLEKSNSLCLPKPASLMRPSDYTSLKSCKLIYSGSVGSLRSLDINSSGIACAS